MGNTFIGKKMDNDRDFSRTFQGPRKSEAAKERDLAARQALAQNQIDRKKDWASYQSPPTGTTGGASTLG